MSPWHDDEQQQQQQRNVSGRFVCKNKKQKTINTHQHHSTPSCSLTHLVQSLGLTKNQFCFSFFDFCFDTNQYTTTTTTSVYAVHNQEQDEKKNSKLKKKKEMEKKRNEKKNGAVSFTFFLSSLRSYFFRTS